MWICGVCHDVCAVAVKALLLMISCLKPAIVALLSTRTVQAVITCKQLPLKRHMSMKDPPCTKAGCAHTANPGITPSPIYKMPYLSQLCYSCLLLSMLTLHYLNKSIFGPHLCSASALQEISQFPYAGAYVYACASSLPSYVSVKQTNLLTPCPLQQACQHVCF